MTVQNKIDNKFFRYKYLILLAIIYPITYFAPDIISYKLVSIHHIVTTAAIYVFVFSFLLDDIITEVYGYKIARHIIWCTLIADVIFNLIINITLHLPAPSFWHHQKAYETVLGSSYRVTLSDVAIPVGIFINSITLSKLKIRFSGKYFWFRSVLSSFIGQLVESLLTYSIIFLGTMPFPRVFHLMVAGFIIKILYSAIAAVPLTYLTSFIKRKENLDVYDYNINYNPFRFALSNQP